MPAAAIPDSPLGLFVKKNYAPKNQRGVFKKLKKSGFKPPTARTTVEGPTTVTDTSSTGGLTQAQRRYLPDELIGVTGVLGPYRRSPRVDQSKYFIVPNKFGSFFAAPYTETTGLSPQEKTDLRTYDEATAKQQPVIQQTYADLQAALNQNAEASKARLASLGSLIGSGSQGYPLGPSSTPAGLDTQLAESRRGQATAESAVTVGQMSALPAVAATEGARYLSEFMAARQGARTELLQTFRQRAAERLQQTFEAEQASKELAAQMRGQDLQLLGTQITTRGGLAKAEISANADTQQTLATLQNRLQIAMINGNVSEANSIRSQIARIESANIAAQARVATDDTPGGGKGKGGKRAAGQPGTPQYQVARRNYVNTLRDFFYDSDGDLRPDADTEKAFQRGLAVGLRPVHVLAALRTLDANYGEDRGDAREILAVLLRNRMPRRRATRIVYDLTGHDFMAPGNA